MRRNLQIERDSKQSGTISQKTRDSITQKCKIQLAFLLSIFVGLQTTTTADQCPPNFEDCITVTEQRPSCIRDDCREIPPNFSADCFKSLVDYNNPVISGEYLEQRTNRLHPGIDIAVPNGTRVNALKKGTVIQLKRGVKKEIDQYQTEITLE